MITSFRAVGEKFLIPALTIASTGKSPRRDYLYLPCIRRPRRNELLRY